MTKRTILAFVLSGLFFVLYSLALNFYYAKVAPPAKPSGPAGAQQPQPVERQPEVPAVTGQEQPQPAAPEPPEETAPQPAAPPGAAAVPDGYKAQNVDDTPVTIANDVLTVVFTPRNGSIKSVTLNRFENLQRNGKLVLLSDFQEGLYPTELTALAGMDMAGAGYIAQRPEAPGEPGRQQIVFVTEAGGLRVTKAYTLYDGKYGMGLAVKVENTQPAAREINYEITGPTGIPSETDRNKGIDAQYITASTLPSGQASPQSFRPFPAWQLLGKDASTPAGQKVTYAGTINQYFASVIRPSPDVPVETAACFSIADSEARRLHPEAPTLEEVRGIPSVVDENAGAFSRFGSWVGRKMEGRRDLRGEGLAKLQPVYFRAAARIVTGKFQLGGAGGEGSSATHSYLLYCGPKDKIALAAFDDSGSPATGFSTLLDYGKYLDWFVRVLLWLLEKFHDAIPNWGISIILLTILVRGALHPLTRRTQVSMAKVQKLQPEIRKLEEKYKHDKQKARMEQMKLMKEKGANPLGGCLPLLIQMPVFIALYRALGVSVELRQAPFFLWINDLARPDRLFNLGALDLPVIHNEINLLPLLMMAAMLIQSRMSPTAATPEQAQQQKFMGLLMPIVVGAMLYGMASGLNLYIFTSTGLGLLEQWAIKRHIQSKGLA